ncbi:hypothetical protein Bbelb_186780 [Branchiostoma belcheri]|nr:hypothetical protein Bbelb_186780 [Branchiostoma belcheri]
MALLGSVNSQLSFTRRSFVSESSQKKFRDISKKPSDDPQYLFPPDLGSKAKEMASEDKAVSGLLQKEGSTNKASGSSQNFRRGGGAGSGGNRGRDTRYFPRTNYSYAGSSYQSRPSYYNSSRSFRSKPAGDGKRQQKKEWGPAFDRTAKCTSSVSAASCRQWQQVTTDPWILQCVQGYKLEFATTPPIQGRLPLSRPRDDAQAAVIDEEVRTLLTKGAVTEVPYHHTQFVSTLFTVPKKTGGLRPVINLKPLNKFLHKQRFKMESLRLIKHKVRPGDYMAKLDLTDAYFTIPVHKDDRKYLTFHWRGRFYQFQCLPFGIATAPRVFTKVMKVPIALLQSEVLLCDFHREKVRKREEAREWGMLLRTEGYDEATSRLHESQLWGENERLRSWLNNKWLKATCIKESRYLIDIKPTWTSSSAGTDRILLGHIAEQHYISLGTGEKQSRRRRRPEIPPTRNSFDLNSTRGRTQYSTEAANLLANLAADWSEAVAALATNNRTVNLQDREGHGKAVDMLMEHFKKYDKTEVKSLGCLDDFEAYGGIEPRILPPQVQPARYEGRSSEFRTALTKEEEPSNTLNPEAVKSAKTA